MKKTSIALLIGLFAFGCSENAPKKATTTTSPMPNPADMAKHMSPPGGHAPSADAEVKKEDEKKHESEVDGAAADPHATEAPK